MESNILAIIQKKLIEIEEKENVKILYAVESGSRAWGFESPDSDYDVRFVYVRPKEDYLSLYQKRDVIEWQLDEVLDINGWDIRKTLIHFQKSNATLFEWSNSPIVYKMTEEWAFIYSKAKEYFSVKAAAYHYYGTAVSTYQKYLLDDSISYKKYFYALRPLLAGEYIRKYLCPPPVLFSDLLQMEMGEALKESIAELLILKKQAGEKAQGKPIEVIQEYIIKEIEWQKEYVSLLESDLKMDCGQLDCMFRQLLG